MDEYGEPDDVISLSDQAIRARVHAEAPNLQQIRIDVEFLLARVQILKEQRDRLHQLIKRTHHQEAE